MLMFSLIIIFAILSDKLWSTTIIMSRVLSKSTDDCWLHQLCLLSFNSHYTRNKVLLSLLLLILLLSRQICSFSILDNWWKIMLAVKQRKAIFMLSSFHIACFRLWHTTGLTVFPHRLIGEFLVGFMSLLSIIKTCLVLWTHILIASFIYLK